jgi:hypothetical protein
MMWKIVLLWVAYLALFLGSQLVLPHRPVPASGSVNFGLQFLVFLLCFHMVRKDIKAVRPALVNLTIFFGFSLLLYASSFMGTFFFPEQPYMSVYYHEFVNKFGYNAVLALAIVYLVVDLWLQNRSTVAKYALTLGVSVSMLAPVYYPYFKDPLHLTRTEEWSRYLEVKTAYNTLLKEKGAEPSLAEITRRVLRGRSQKIDALGAEDRSRTEQEIEGLSAYLTNGNEVTLFWKPLNLDTVYVNLMLIGLLIAFYVRKFFHDPPHGAYLEKIAFLLFLLCSLEVLHQWAFTKSADAQVYLSIFSIGQYLNIAVLLALVYVCSVRLRFLSSPVGQYYERQVLIHPEKISRWRDEIDQLILRSFLRKTPFADRVALLERDKNSQQ